MEDRSVKHPLFVLEDIPVRVYEFYIQFLFYVLDMDEDMHIPIIIGMSFLSIAGCRNYWDGSTTLETGDEHTIFNLDLALIGRMTEDTCCSLDILIWFLQDAMEYI